MTQNSPRPTDIVLHQQSRILEVAVDDGQDSGLYSWQLLHELGAHHEEKWRDYLERLKKAGIQRNAP